MFCGGSCRPGVAYCLIPLPSPSLSKPYKPSKPFKPSQIQFNPPPLLPPFLISSSHLHPTLTHWPGSLLIGSAPSSSPPPLPHKHYPLPTTHHAHPPSPKSLRPPPNPPVLKVRLSPVSHSLLLTLARSFSSQFQVLCLLNSASNFRPFHVSFLHPTC